MDPLRILAETAGFFTRYQARDLGYDDRDVAAAVRVRLWHRIRRGYYTFTDLWCALDEVGRHVVLTHAVTHSLGRDKVAASHVSGCALHGIDIWGVDLSRVHVTRLDGGPGRVEGDVVHHEGVCLDSEVTDIDGVLVLLPARCAIEAGSRATNEQALVLFDSLLHRECATVEELMEQFTLMQRWPFVRHLQIPIRMADPRAASVGETRGRWLFRCSHIPAPELQYEVRNRDGVLLGTTDWAWPQHGALGEFDGKIKYGRLVRPDQQPGDVVFAEKQREELLCRVSGLPRMIRLVWDDLAYPRLTSARVLRSLDVAS